jgi:hypothetical protein
VGKEIMETVANNVHCYIISKTPDNLEEVSIDQKTDKICLVRKERFGFF